MIAWIAAALAGAAGMYFLDPDRGKRRRAMARDRAAGLVNDASRIARRTATRAGAEAYGIGQKAAHPRGTEEPPPNDASLSQKVMTELFRDPRIPKGSINVNSQHGVVQLRGQVEHPETIREIEDRVRDIEGVEDVENLLHLPGTPAPRS